MRRSMPGAGVDGGAKPREQVSRPFGAGGQSNGIEPVFSSGDGFHDSMKEKRL